MSYYDQHQAPPPVYPPPPTLYPPPAEGNPQKIYVAPPPASYPTKDGAEYPQGETKEKGGGFWRGCCAGLCCCCFLDMCF